MTIKEQYLQLLDDSSVRFDIVKEIRNAEDFALLNPGSYAVCGFRAYAEEGIQYETIMKSFPYAMIVGGSFQSEECDNYDVLHVSHYNSKDDVISLLFDESSDEKFTKEDITNDDDMFRAWVMHKTLSLHDDYDTYWEDEIIDSFRDIISARHVPQEDDWFSEIFYTGGGIWCGVIKMSDGTWFGGEISDGGCFYENEVDAWDFFADQSDSFIRFTDESDRKMIMNLWKKAIEHEKTNVHDLACYCDEWMKEWKHCKHCGDYEYM